MPEINSLTLKTDANIKAYYRFESGARLTDSSTNAKTLTNVGTPTYAVSKFGDGLDVKATANYVYYNGDIGLTGDGSASVSMWVKLNNEIGAGTYSFCQHEINTGTTRYFTFYYNYNAGTRQIQLAASGTDLYYTVTLGTANWHHFVIVRTTTTNIKVYLDNVEVISNTPGTGASGAALFRIGSNGASHSDAKIDDVAVFDRVLTPAEISTIYNEAVSSGSSGMFLAF